MPRAITANRWLLLLASALACLAIPSSAAATTFNPVVTGTLGDNGWYVSNVKVDWNWNPTPDQVNGCFVGTITAEGAKHIDPRHLHRQDGARRSSGSQPDA